MTPFIRSSKNNNLCIHLVTNHARYWLALFNIVALVTFILSVVYQMYYLNTLSSCYEYLIILINAAVLSLNIAYFLISNASEMFIVTPTFFSPITDKEKNTQNYRFEVKPYIGDKYNFKATLESISVRQFGETKVTSANEEGRGLEMPRESEDEGTRRSVTFVIGKEIRKGFFFSFVLSPRLDLDGISDIQNFQNSLAVEIRILYRKRRVIYEIRKDIP